MAAAAAVHPSDQTLQSYGLGKLDDLLAEAVGKHLEDCPTCRGRVAEVTSDTFVGRLQDAQARPDTAPPVGSSLAGLSKLESEPRPAAPPPASTLPPGLAEHPDYEIVRELGRGGMGVVYLAENRMMGRKEVLKVVNAQLLNRKGVMDRFQREIRSAAQLHHPNIVTAYSATRVGESIVFSMEYVKGFDLADAVAKSPLSVAYACNFVHQAALGLQHAHEHGMVHRDIKPSNLMLARDGSKPVIKILDFGLAKVTSEGAVDGGLTHEGQMLGTPHYIAPEQTVSAQKADIRADIYSLGCTLYCLLTGHPPFDAPSLYELLQAHHSMDAKPLNFIRPEVPAELAAVVAKMLAKEPERRYQTPAEVAEALKPFFKKDFLNSKAQKPEMSQVGLVDPKQEPTKVAISATQPQPTANSASEQTVAGSRAEPEWENLIDINETEDAGDVVAVVSRSRRQWPRWFWATIAGAFSFAMIALGITIYVATDYGRIKIIVEGPKADVQVDGQRILIKTPRESITLHAGEHELKVKWRDGQSKTRNFVVRRGQEDDLSVEYESRETDRTGTNRRTSPSSKTASRDTVEGPAAAPTVEPQASSVTAWMTNSIAMEFALIPAGEFMMGSPDAGGEGGHEKPQHWVHITQPFYLGVHEVTQAQYEAVMGNNPSYFSAAGGGKDKVAGQSTVQHPVEMVSWFDAVKFCNKLSELEGRKPFYEIDGETVRVPDWKAPGYRLPTDAEWEYACGGDPSNVDEHTWFAGNSGQVTHPVGKKRANRFGLRDMLGNVWEWCWDAFEDYYKQSPRDDPTGPDAAGAAFRVIRGGSWHSDPLGCRSADRNRSAPDNRGYNLGFRLALVQ